MTTHDELFRDAAFLEAGSAATKEVARYSQALRVGFEVVNTTGLLSNNHIIEIQSQLEQNTAGFRKLVGTALKASDGRVVYTPPQDPQTIEALMAELERFINEPERFAVDPLIKMALIHHQFESIHPFYDGNGRTGRIINVLYLVKEGLLDIPVLYLSRHIVRTKSDYYRLLQGVRDRGVWEEWVLYVLTAVEQTAAEGISTIQAIKGLLLDYKHRIRQKHRFYSQDWINNLFSHPHEDRIHTERPECVAAVCDEVPGCASGRWVCPQAEDWALELLHQRAALQHPHGGAAADEGRGAVADRACS